MIVEIDASDIGYGGILKQKVSPQDPEQLVRYHDIQYEERGSFRSSSLTDSFPSRPFRKGVARMVSPLRRSLRSSAGG